jgi:hypothetical protein
MVQLCDVTVNKNQSGSVMEHVPAQKATSGGETYNYVVVSLFNDMAAVVAEYLI